MKSVPFPTQRALLRHTGLRTMLALVCTVAVAACGSSSSTSTTPTPVPRCGVSVATSDLSVPASGGTGTLSVTTGRECAWTASSTASWLSIRGSSSGQGDGAVEYVAAANSDPAVRRAVIELNDQRTNVTQGAADCAMQLRETSAAFAPTGGSGTIDVRASSPQCTWTAVPDASWITIRSGATGTGNGTVGFDVAAASGPPRTGTVVVAGLRFSITQSQGCTYAATPVSAAVAAGGGSTTITVSAGAGCPWTAASNVPWITVAQGATGNGPGTVQVVTAATSGPDRTGTVLVAGQSINVTQSAGCGFAVDPLVHAIGAQGGTGSATIQAAAGCAWTASSNSSWITLTGPTSGAGSGAIAFAVAPVSGPARTGTIAVAGTQLTVTQSAGCTFAISPQSQSVDPAGGDITVSVTAADGCAWTASGGASWITVASGASGSGNGTVRLTIASSSGASRSGTATIAGQSFTVNQGSGCAFSIAPTSASVAAAGGTGSVAVTTTAGCAWTATSNASWLTVTSGASGSGAGTVQYSAASMTGGPRSGTLTIAGQTFTVNQGSGCAFSIAPTSASVAAAGGTGSVAVTTTAGCAWTATSNASWLTVTGGASGSGSGTVQYSAASTTGGARSGTLTIAGQTFTVNQGSGCAFSIAPTSASVPAPGGSGSVVVTTTAGCAWSATSDVSWLSVTSGASGTGSGTVQYSAAAVTGGARSGTMTIAGQTFTVSQAGNCTIDIAPTSAAVGVNGGSASVAVTAGAGCAWIAVSNAPWITVGLGSSGTGNGTVQLVAAGNSGGARSGTVTIGGQTFTLNQGANCSFAAAPTTITAPAAGGSNNVSVTTTAGCAWTSSSGASWITVGSGASGTGNGTTQLVIAANPGSARSGSAAVAGQTVTVNQAAGCSFAIAPTNANVIAGANTVAVTVTTTAGCAWTAASNASFVTVTSGASGTGSGSVQLAVAANTGAVRSGTATIAGMTLTINQASSCTYALVPAVRDAASRGESSNFMVMTAATCPWTATSNVPWITVTSGSSGTGTGTVAYSVQVNDSSAVRSGTITVSGQTFTVNQAR